jgi:hypothetical protein
VTEAAKASSLLPSVGIPCDFHFCNCFIAS